jgi:FkbM family methyltransferase
MLAEMNVDRVLQDLLFKEDPTKTGILVEVGAAGPDYLSISSSFRNLGWKIISVEPNPDFCKLHRDLGYTIYQYACGDTESDSQNFYVVDSQGEKYLDGTVSFESFSSLGIKDEFLDLYQTVKDRTNIKTLQVKVRKLDTILAKYEPDVTKVDIAAVDVEGWELNVMRGFSVERYQPPVVILENLFKKYDYVDYMERVGYKLWQHLHPNDIYFDNATHLRVSSKSSLVERLVRLFNDRHFKISRLRRARGSRRR